MLHPYKSMGKSKGVAKCDPIKVTGKLKNTINKHKKDSLKLSFFIAWQVKYNIGLSPNGKARDYSSSVGSIPTSSALIKGVGPKPMSFCPEQDV